MEGSGYGPQNEGAPLMRAAWMGAGTGGGDGVSGEMGADRKERLYLCFWRLAAEGTAECAASLGLCFQEWLHVNVRARSCVCVCVYTSNIEQLMHESRLTVLSLSQVCK